METSIEHLHKDIVEIKKSLELIRHIIEEDYELSDETKKELEEARKTPRSKYIDHEIIKKKFLK